MPSNFLIYVPGTDVDLAEETEVLVELILGTKGIEGVRGTEVPKGVLGPKGTDLLAAVLVKVELTEALDSVGGARLRSLDVRGSCKKAAMGQCDDGKCTDTKIRKTNRVKALTS